MWKSIRENPRAVLYAVLMHLVLLVLLVFSLDWTPKISRPAGVKVPIEAKLVDPDRLQAIEAQKQEEQRRLEAERRAAEAAKQKAEAEKQRQVEAARQQAEAEKQRKAAEARKKAEAEKKRKAEAARKKAEAEKQRQAEAARKKAEAEKQRRAEAARKKAEAEKKRKAEEAARRREAEQALQAQLAAEQAERDQGVVAEYTAYIQEQIQRNWLKPAGSPPGLSCTVQVSLIPGGDVARVQIVRSSGDPLFDDSVEKAVYKASPMPLPQDAALFKYFRELRLIFKPR